MASDLFKSMQVSYQQAKNAAAPGYDYACGLIQANVLHGSVRILPDSNGVWPVSEQALNQLKAEGFAITLGGVDRMSIYLPGAKSVTISWDHTPR